MDPVGMTYDQPRLVEAKSIIRTVKAHSAKKFRMTRRTGRTG